MGMMQEFKDFAIKGNMVDMAIGIIIGGAFGTIVKSLVEDIVMPPIGLALGGVDFSSLFINLGEGTYASLDAAKEAGAPVLAYGNFFNNIIAFLIVVFAVFLLVKGMNKLKKKEEEKPAAPPKQEVLLEEIRDALKKQNA